MLDKRSDIASALAPVKDGAVVLISGFGDAGSPVELIHGLIDHGAKDLTIVNNNAGSGDTGLAALLRLGRVRKLICSYPRATGGETGPFEDLYRRKQIELELVPQGTLAERLRAGGAGIPAFYTPTGAHSEINADKEKRTFNNRLYVLEHALRGDVALIKAEMADRWGNLTYRKAARNFGPVMATAADLTIVQVRSLVELGALDAETVITPGIFVDRVVLSTRMEAEFNAAATLSVAP